MQHVFFLSKGSSGFTMAPWLDCLFIILPLWDFLYFTSGNSRKIVHPAPNNPNVPVSIPRECFWHKTCRAIGGWESWNIYTVSSQIMLGMGIF